MDIKNLGAKKLEPANLRELGNPEMSLKKSGKDSPEAIKKAATQFEALLLGQMLNSMWATVPKSELTGSKEEEMYRDMLNQAMAEDIADKQSIGVRDVIAKDISKIESRLKK
jgi:flagellar protein FlgJ